MKIHFGSFVRSGTLAAVMAGFLYLLSLTPFFNNVILILMVLGAIVIPLGAGLYYGYLAPGEETAGQSIVGGALSGLVGGIILGIAFGINAFTMGLVSTGLGFAVAGSLAVTILVIVVAGIFAAIMGGIGGALWQLVQD